MLKAQVSVGACQPDESKLEMINGAPASPSSNGEKSRRRRRTDRQGEEMEYEERNGLFRFAPPANAAAAAREKSFTWRLHCSGNDVRSRQTATAATIIALTFVPTATQPPPLSAVSSDSRWYNQGKELPKGGNREGSKGGTVCTASEVIALAATANDDDGPLWPTPQTAEETWTTMIRGMRCPVRPFLRPFVRSFSGCGLRCAGRPALPCSMMLCSYSSSSSLSPRLLRLESCWGEK